MTTGLEGNRVLGPRIFFTRLDLDACLARAEPIVSRRRDHTVNVTGPVAEGRLNRAGFEMYLWGGAHSLR